MIIIKKNQVIKKTVAGKTTKVEEDSVEKKIA